MESVKNPYDFDVEPEYLNQDTYIDDVAYFTEKIDTCGVIRGIKL